MTTIYLGIAVVFTGCFAMAHPGFRLWLSVQRYKLRRRMGWGGGAPSGTAAMRAQRLPGNNAAADEEAEAQAEEAWRRRRAAQAKAGRAAKPGRATKAAPQHGATSGRRARKRAIGRRHRGYIYWIS